MRLCQRRAQDRDTRLGIALPWASDIGITTAAGVHVAKLPEKLVLVKSLSVCLHICASLSFSPVFVRQPEDGLYILYLIVVFHLQVSPYFSIFL
jgi:hypothetical protein